MAVLEEGLSHSEGSAATFWCVFRARSHVGDPLLLQVDVAGGGVAGQRLY